MKCLLVQSTNVPSQKQQTFNGIPERIGYMKVRNWHDAVRWWEELRHTKYLDVHNNEKCPQSKAIREYNYSFLNKLTSHRDMSEFIRVYCDFSGFPYLKRVNSNIKQTLKNCLFNISNTRNSSSSDGKAFGILDYGCDPACSVGLGKALPGSDLDKGYIILKGVGDVEKDKEIVRIFKRDLWNNLDQRILSLNHPRTVPDISTPSLIKEKLNKYDITAKSTESKNKIKTSVLEWFSPIFGIPSKQFQDKNLYKCIKASNETDPYKAGKFNRDFAKKIHTPQERREVKNFAFFIETVEMNYKVNPAGKDAQIFKDIINSSFVKNSNVSLQGAWYRLIPLKTK